MTYRNVYGVAYDRAHAKAYAEFYHEAYDERYAKAYNNSYVKFIAEAEAGAGIRATDRAEARVKADAEANARAYAEVHAKSHAKAHAKVEAVASAEAHAEAEAKAEAEALTTPPHNLATDCLRLSMHFFYPIQQCAQQVYHTAIPLSPTTSHLHKSYLQSVIDHQLSHVAAYSGAPSTWGLVLRTINLRPRQLTCITTSAERIITACEEIVNIYDAVTFMLQQSLCASAAVTKIQNSSDGSILLFAHSFSITMWDVQTGGLIHTFTTQSGINDIAISETGDHIACYSSDGSITFWNTHTKMERKHFVDGQSVVAIHWISPRDLTVATKKSVCIYNITVGKTSNKYFTFGSVWGMAYLGQHKYLVGISQPSEVDQGLYTFVPIEYIQGRLCRQSWKSPTPMPLRQLTHPILAGKRIVCMTPPSGVQLFDAKSCCQTENPPLLDAAISVAVSLDRNLVVQTKDSLQIFSLDVLASCENHKNIPLSHIYPLGEKHIICVLQPNRHLTLLELETLREPDESTLPPRSLLVNHLSSAPELVAEFGVLAIAQAWESGTPLPEWTGAIEEDAPLSRLSPEFTLVVTVYSSPRRVLWVKDAKDGTVLANLSPEGEGFGTGEIYDLTFDSETRFYLNMDRSGQHVQIPCDVIASPSGNYSHTISRGEPVTLSEPRGKPPYTLDASCDWVVDAESRKICWVSPGNIRRGNGGHFWAGLSLVMVGDDGVVRKLSFKEPDC